MLNDYKTQGFNLSKVFTKEAVAYPFQPYSYLSNKNIKLIVSAAAIFSPFAYFMLKKEPSRLTKLVENLPSFTGSNSSITGLRNLSRVNSFLIFGTVLSTGFYFFGRPDSFYRPAGSFSRPAGSFSRPAGSSSRPADSFYRPAGSFSSSPSSDQIKKFNELYLRVCNLSDPLEILEITCESEVRAANAANKAKNRLIKISHPDKNSNDRVKATKLTEKIQKAYDEAISLIGSR